MREGEGQADRRWAAQSGSQSREAGEEEEEDGFELQGWNSGILPTL